MSSDCLLPLFVSLFALAGPFSSAQTMNPSGTPGSAALASPPILTSSTSSSIPASANDGKVTFRTQTVLIQVPVIVTDKHGDHVHGLTKNDFRVFENGKVQTLSSFEELIATKDAFPSVPLKPGQYGNLTLSEEKPRPVTVIVLDTVNTPYLNQTYGRRELVKYLADHLDTSQILALMVITSHGVKVIQGLDGDSTKLIQALKKASSEIPYLQGINTDTQAAAATGDIPRIPPPGADPSLAIEAFIERVDALDAQFQQRNAIETTMNGFLGVAWALSGVPGRKSVVWATGGFPFTMYSSNQAPNTDLSTLYERTMHALEEAQVAVYPIDVRGLLDSSSVSEASSSRMPNARRINDRAWLEGSTIDSLNEVADMTGGKAFYNTNDLTESFRRASDDESSYYLLGYYVDTHNRPAGWRQLKVKVDKDNIEIRARKGFFVTDDMTRAASNKSSDMNYALTADLEGTGVPVMVEWAGIASEGEKKKAHFVAHMPPNALVIDALARNKIDFDFAAVAIREKDSREVARSASNFSKELADSQVASIRSNGVVFKNALEVTPGKYTVRFVVRDNFTGKVGSVTAPLTVN